MTTNTPDPAPRAKRARKLPNGREEIFMSRSILIKPSALRVTPAEADPRHERPSK